MREAGALWIDAVKKDGRARITWTKYQSHLDRHIAPVAVTPADGAPARAFGDVALALLTTPLVARFKKALQGSGRSPAMVQKVMASLRMLLNAAQLEGLVPYNVATAVRAKRGERHRERARPPAPQELQRILAALEAAGGPPTLGATWIRLAAQTGLRPGEMRALAWDQVQLDARPPTLEVTRAADERGQIGPPKSRAGRRRVPLPAGLVQLLKAWRVRCPKSALRLVFPTAAGHVQNLANVHNRIWRPLLERLGMTIEGSGKRDEFGRLKLDAQGCAIRPKLQFKLYDLRYFFASAMIALGANPKELQVVMGHEDVQLTLNTYAHLFEDRDRDQSRAAALELMLSGKSA